MNMIQIRNNIICLVPYLLRLLNLNKEKTRITLVLIKNNLINFITFL
jgi:hypothetical protein